MSEYAWLEKACGMYDNGNHKDGDILSHDWLRFALDIPRPKNLREAEEVQWLALARIEAFKEWVLVERKTVLKSVRGKGILDCTPQRAGASCCGRGHETCTERTGARFPNDGARPHGRNG
jgi:hypothetical protein